MASPPPNSVSSLWAATVGSGNDAATSSSAEPESLAASDVTAFVGVIQQSFDAWGQLFTQVPNGHQRRKEALGGALKIKSATKRLEKVLSGLVESDSAAAGEGDAAAESTSLAESLVECRATFHEAVLGLLEVSFPCDETLSNNDFKDVAGVSSTLQRIESVTNLTSDLGRLFARGKVELKPMKVGGDESLAPEVMKMLEKSIKKQKKKEKEKQKNGGKASAEASAAALAAARAVWQKTDGRCSCVLGEEVWEGLCWRQGIFLFQYIRQLVEEEEKKQDAKAEAPAISEAASSLPPLSRSLFADCMRSFHLMLLAQGPIPADIEDPASWKVASDGPHDDESARLFYHGIYSSTHLRGLKQLAELSFWQWKHCGCSKEDAKLAALINRKFAHIVRHIMPHAGWTADVEFDRIVEIEKASLDSSEFSTGLSDSSVHESKENKPIADKPKSKSGKSGGYSGGKSGKSGGADETAAKADAVEAEAKAEDK